MEKIDYKEEFKQFGSKIYIIGILTILTLFTLGLIQIAISILLILSLKHIKKINEGLENTFLSKFRIRILIAAVINLIGAVISVVITIFLNVFILRFGVIHYPLSAQSVATFWMLLRLFLFIMIFAAILGFITGVLNMIAWNELNNFFREKKDVFPLNISKKAIKGAVRLRKAYLFIIVVGVLVTLMTIYLFLLPFTVATYYGSIVHLFIIIFPIILGIVTGILGLMSFIFTILGYFDLSNLK
ncbi:MAG: hypothetical protein P8Y70_01305, partial [Candidatus Lokiarchaeota archaeon]